MFLGTSSFIFKTFNVKEIPLTDQTIQMRLKQIELRPKIKFNPNPL